MLLAIDGQVHDDLVGGDVARDDADPGDLVGIGGRLDGRLAERLVHLLDATLQGACFPGCFGRWLVVVVCDSGRGISRLGLATRSGDWAGLYACPIIINIA